MKRAILLAAIVALAAVNAHASGGVTYPPECVSNGQVICARLQGNSTGIVQADGYCAQLTNSTGNDYFIPLRTGTERHDFLTHAPSIGVSIVSCCLSPSCTPGP